MESVKTEDKIIKKQLKISLPIAFENLSTTLMSLIDAVIVAKLGTSFVSAIGAISVILSILQMAPQALSVSNIALMTKYPNETKQRKHYLSHALLLCFGICVLAIIIACSISPILPALFKVDIIANTYLYIRLAGFVQSSLLTVLYGYLRVENKQNIVLLIQIISIIFNLIFDLIAVTFGGGIIGVACVTISIDSFAMIVAFILARPSATLNFVKEKTSALLKLFSWNFLERIISKIDYFIFNILVARMGNDQYAVHTILLQISNSAQSFIQGFSDGMTLTIGKISDENEMNITLKNFKRMILWCCLIIPVLLSAISVAIIYLAFSEMSLILLSLEILPILIVTCVVITYASFYFAYLRGIRKFKFLAIRNLISSVVKIAIATGLSFTILGIFGVWSSYLIYNLMQWILSQSYYKKLQKTTLLQHEQ